MTDQERIVRHGIQYHRRGGYDQPEWVAVCECGWQSKVYPKFDPTRSAANEHRQAQQPPRGDAA